MEKRKEKRKEKRINFRSFIQYEKTFEDGNFSIPIATTARDIGNNGMVFYSEEKLELGSKVRIKFSISQSEEIYYLGCVKRIELSDNKVSKYIVGVEVENIKDEDRKRLSELLDKINIYNVLDKLDLENVSDIHFVCGYPPMLKKMSKLEATDMKPFNEYSLRILLLSMLDHKQYKDFIKNNESNFIFDYHEKNRFRVNFHVQRHKVEGVFRVIPQNIGLPHQLGLPDVVEKLLENKKGLILVGGRTGAGKSTTLASMVELLNNKTMGVIISIEDPIEYIHTNNKCIIKQREVGSDTFSFSVAAKNALRQNPDILVIGEILERETMEVALTAAEAGTLVLTSIHGITSPQVMDRIVSFFPIDAQKYILSRLSLILKGMITQELIPRLDGKGFAVAAEILVVNDAIKRIIRDDDWKEISTAILGGRKLKMQSMRESIERLYRDGVIDGEYLKGVML